MKISLASHLVLVSILSGCAGTTDIDLSKAEYTCGQSCSTSFSTCDGRLTMMPIRQHNDCVDQYRSCVHSCPPSSTAVPITTNKQSVTDRLKELDALHKNGAITDVEYETKRQEILKAL